MSDGTSELQLISSAFKDNEAVPEQYTCRGQNINPPLNIVGKPEGTKSLALIMHDPDAVSGDYVHWLMWDIPPGTDTIAANSVPVGAIQGPNGSGDNKYTGPCPPAGTGTHHYKFDLYALNTTLSLNPKTNREDLVKALEGRFLAQSTLTGLVDAN